MPLCYWSHVVVLYVSDYIFLAGPSNLLLGPYCEFVYDPSHPQVTIKYSTQQTMLEMAASLFAQRPTSTPMLESYLALSVSSQDKVT